MLTMRQYKSTYIIAALRGSVPPGNFGANITWTSMPLAQSDMYSGVASDTYKPWYSSSPLTYFDFGGFVINIGTAGSASSVVKAQYSVDGGANYFDMGAPNNSLSISTTGQKIGKFSIPDAAKAAQDTIVRVVGSGGNGVTSPVFNVASGSNGILFGTQPINIVVDLDPPIRNACITRKREMVLFRTAFSFGTLVWTNMPLAQTEWFGVTTRRITAFFTNPGTEMLKLEFHMGVAGSANAVMKIQYSLDGGTNWSFIDSETTNTGAPCSVSATGWRLSTSWVKVDEAARVDAGVLCRLVGSGGDGVADPQFTGGATGYAIGCRFNPAS